jgi:hypothetical protein
MKWFAIFLQLVGYGVLLFADWRVALGVFLCHWAINIEYRNAYVRMLARGVPQKPFNMKTLPLSEGNLAQVDDLRELSYLTYGRDRATVEASIRARYLS